MNTTYTTPSLPGLGLARPNTPGQVFKQFVTTGQTIADVAQGKTSDDGHLAHVDKTMRVGGGVTIAALAAKLRTGRWAAIPEVFGLAGWYASMAATPWALHAAIQQKTGINLGQLYTNPEHTKVRFYQDADYMPLHLIPLQERRLIAQKLGIPEEHPHFNELVDEKIRQVARQGQTSWMLIAGPATPILTALLVSQTEHPAAYGLSRAQQWGLGLKHQWHVLRQNPDKATKALANWLQHTHQHVLGQWSAQWNRKLAKVWQLPHGTPATLPNLLTHIHKLTPLQQEAITHTLNTQLLQLKQWQTDVTQRVSHQPQPATVQAALANVQHRMTRALNGVQRQLDALNAAKTQPLNALPQWLDDLTPSRVSQLIDKGQFNRLNQLLGHGSALKALQFLQKSDTEGLAALLGQAPAQALLTSWQQAQQTIGWRNRYLLGAGGALLALSTALVTLVVGRKATPEQLIWNDGPFTPADKAHHLPAPPAVLPAQKVGPGG
jgi:hypothetical protein